MNKTNFLDNIKCEDNNIEEAKQFLGEYYIKKNTETGVYSIPKVNVACRFRRNTYITKYPNDFTVRLILSSKGKTEYEKFMDGYGDSMFYGFLNRDEDKIIKYSILDLDIFRDQARNVRCHIQSNGEGDSDFLAYKIGVFPLGFVLEQEKFLDKKEKIHTIDDRIKRTLGKKFFKKNSTMDTKYATDLYIKKDISCSVEIKENDILKVSVIE